MSDPSSNPTDIRHRTVRHPAGSAAAVEAATTEAAAAALDSRPTTTRPLTVRTNQPRPSNGITECIPPGTTPDLSPAAAWALLKLLLAADRSHRSTPNKEPHDHRPT